VAVRWAVETLNINKPHIVEGGTNANKDLQKRAFVCLMRMLKASNLRKWTSEHRDELVDILQQSLVVGTEPCIKCTRLVCLRKLFSSVDQGEQSARAWQTSWRSCWARFCSASRWSIRLFRRMRNNLRRIPANFCRILCVIKGIHCEVLALLR